MFSNKKAVHPVVAVALLLVVAVVSVVVFQGWFTSFSAKTLTQVEQDTGDQIPSDLYVAELTTSSVYLKSHTGRSNITNIKIINVSNGVELCNLNPNVILASGMSSINVSSCPIERKEVYEILITTQNQLIQNQKIAR